MTIETATEGRKVVQFDNMEVTVGNEIDHFQICIDEASGFGAATFLFTHPGLKVARQLGWSLWRLFTRDGSSSLDIHAFWSWIRKAITGA